MIKLFEKFIHKSNDNIPQPADPAGQATERQPNVLENFDYNKQMWDGYAEWWTKEKVIVEDATIVQNREERLKYLGDEWGISADVDEILNEFVLPYIKNTDVIGEIGSGGGRVASRLVDKCKEFYCFDISREMLKKVSEALSNQKNINYVLLETSGIPASLEEKFDFLYAFDVFVHLDLHNLWKYFHSFPKALKPGGKVFVHTTNLTAPDGWNRFAEQDSFSIHGHYFITPETVRTLAKNAGLKVIKESTPKEGNFYLNRDYLAVLERA